jgi:hypothetical protein
MFTQTQASRMLRVIREDANLVGSLFIGDDQACVIGGLYKEAFGLPDYYQILSTNEALAAIVSEYGITRDQGSSLVTMNDGISDTQVRRRALSVMICSWITERV